MVRTINRSGAWPFLLAVILAMAACQKQDAEQGVKSTSAQEDLAKKERIITLGGPVTEVVYALGAGDQVIATDISSTWPAAVASLKKIGYQRTLSAENIIALGPTLILASAEAGPPAAIEQLRASGIRIEVIPSEHSLAGAKQKIDAVAKVLGLEESAKHLRDTIARYAVAADSLQRLAAAGSPAKILFIYARGAGALQASGKGTAADAMLAASGLRNVVTEYDGYKPLTPEAIVAANPQVVLMTTSGLQSISGKEGLLKAVPALAQSDAGRAGRIVAMDDELLLGFGPRSGQAILELRRKIDSVQAMQSPTAARL
ncbi:MAG: ABC transporter substrate-binding protein [Armatimonadetes bacterium]|nr:ABC transporter substrate-binding protein [Armatimonadota bacterium]